MQIDNEKLKIYVDTLDSHLKSALMTAQSMQAEVQKTEGDSDLLRKISMYLVPNLDHWINGLQAGNVKDLKAVLEERITPSKPEKKNKSGKKGDGHKVLTKP
jgi:hypothetical protein